MRLTQLVTAAGLLMATSLTFAQECYKSSILNPTPFMGNSGEIIKLGDGSVWEVKYAYEYWFSVGPAMLVDARGRDLVARMPRDRVVSETDGPYADVRGRPLMPWHVESVPKDCARLWGVGRTRPSGSLIATRPRYGGSRLRTP